MSSVLTWAVVALLILVGLVVLKRQPEENANAPDAGRVNSGPNSDPSVVSVEKQLESAEQAREAARKAGADVFTASDFHAQVEKIESAKQLIREGNLGKARLRLRIAAADLQRMARDAERIKRKKKADTAKIRQNREAAEEVRERAERAIADAREAGEDAGTEDIFKTIERLKESADGDLESGIASKLRRAASSYERVVALVEQAEGMAADRRVWKEKADSLRKTLTALHSKAIEAKVEELDLARAQRFIRDGEIEYKNERYWEAYESFRNAETEFVNAAILAERSALYSPSAGELAPEPYSRSLLLHGDQKDAEGELVVTVHAAPDAYRYRMALGFEKLARDACEGEELDTKLRELHSEHEADKGKALFFVRLTVKLAPRKMIEVPSGPFQPPRSVEEGKAYYFFESGLKQHVSLQQLKVRRSFKIIDQSPRPRFAVWKIFQKGNELKKQLCQFQDSSFSLISRRSIKDGGPVVLTVGNILRVKDDQARQLAGFAVSEGVNVKRRQIMTPYWQSQIVGPFLFEFDLGGAKTPPWPEEFQVYLERAERKP